MCIIKDLIKKKYGEDYTKNFDKEFIEEIAEEVINCKEFEIHKVNTKSMTQIAKFLGFNVHKTEFNDPKISAIINIVNDGNNKTKDIFGNANDSVEHFRFAIAHEIGHYIFDYESNMNFFSEMYYADKESPVMVNKEIRANSFAAALTMPKKSFIEALDKYILVSKKNETDEFVIFVEAVQFLMYKFGMSETAVMKRIIEVRTELSEDTNSLIQKITENKNDKD